MRGLGFGKFARTLWERLGDHDTTGSAAQLGYYLLLSVFPFLLMIVTLAAFLPVGDSVQALLGRLSRVMPHQAMELVRGHLDDLLHNPRPHLLTVGLLAALWSASRGVDSVRKGLNFAYDVKESRPWWRVALIAVGMTIVGTLLVLTAVTMIVLGGKAGEWAADHLHVQRVYHFVWSWLRWPVTALVTMLVAALAYYVLPDVEQEFRFITPGSVAATIVWLLATWGFTLYVEHFSNYNATYGSIGGVIVLMTWFYLSGLIFLVGGEINAVIEHSSPDGKARGARSPDERPAAPLDRPSAGQGKAGEHPVLH